MTVTRASGSIGALMACCVALALSACGGGEQNGDQGSRPGGEKKQAETVEQAFLATMVPHHESAIEMAELARQKGKDPFILQLAQDILRTQTQEIAQMRRIHRRLLGTELESDPGGHDRLGLTAAQAGMTHDAQTIGTLRRAEPFDLAFVDHMIPHHRGAVRMVRVVLQSTQDPELRRLARGIASSQAREIEQMSSFRDKRFGNREPAAGAGGHGEHP